MTPTIQDLIADRLTGSEFVKRLTLLAYIRSRGFDISEREMRKVLTEMKRKGGHLLLSSGRGYKMAETVKEYENCMKYKRSYILSMLAEFRDMKRNFKRATSPLTVNEHNQLTNL